MKALVLLSGGLDSTLAVRLMQEQNIDVEALHFTTIFCNCTSSKASCHSESDYLASKFNVPIKVINNTAPFIEAVKRPKYGYGSNMNPCIDCRINMFKSARKYMTESGASFVVTGEVLGQRPMSQRKQAMRLIEKESGLAGLVLRPLSAHLLEETIPEKNGWVNRAKLLAIKGRSRKPQPGFSARMKDLLTYEPEASTNDMQLLKSGRYFRFDKHTKAIVGRDETDNKVIQARAQAGDLLLEVKDEPGPVTLLRANNGAVTPANIRLAASLTARYADVGKAIQVSVSVRKALTDEPASVVQVTPSNQAEIDRYMVQVNPAL
ncbi:MAG: hypothetical protein HY762_00210 [Planctomycetes bacterium]|nr:hypothetical protein [Planctomycetota bacterium]